MVCRAIIFRKFKASPTLDKAVEISQGMEAAAKQAKELKGSRAAPVLAVDAPAKPCGQCGRGNHDQKDCKFRSATCHKCGKIGHIAPVCRSKQPGKHPKGQAKKTKWVSSTEPDQTSDSQEESLFVVQNKSSPPYKAELEVNGQPLTMEVDTGAAVSLAPESAVASLLTHSTLQPTGVILKTYTGEQIPVKGTMTVDVKYGQQHHKSLKLLVVSGSGPCLMGRDWLRVVRLDWRKIGKVSPTTASVTSRVAALQEQYQEVFSETLGTITPFTAKLSVTPGASPKFFKPRSVPLALKERVESELDRLERDGVLEKTNYSEWAAPVVTVPKPDGQLRLCGDYKVTVNPVLDVDQYPLPKPDDIFATLAGGKQFTTLDLSHAYNQLIMDEESRKFVTINTHKGLYQYTRLPFGIASAPAVFQRIMDTILQGVEGVACYIDDIIITGKSTEEHLERLEEILQRLLRYGIHVKKSKCRFLQSSVIFLGHRIDAEGLHPTKEKLKAIMDAPASKNIQELRSFLGLINYYGKFIPNAATILAPLNDLLRKDAKWKWAEKCQKSFELAKQTLTSSDVLMHYNPDLPICMAGDASAYGIGAVIAHVLPDGTERPVAFASRTLTSSEKNYAQVEKEALSLIFGVKRFHSYLYGRSFTIVTDHKPLTAILGPKKGIPPLAAARLQRWSWILSAYHYEIEFRPTGDHGNADGFSRLPLSDVPPEETNNDSKIFNISQMEALPVTVRQLRAATHSDRILSKVYRYTKGSWPHQVPQYLRPFSDRRNELTVEEGCLLWGIRVIIPHRLRDQLMEELHKDHPGVTRMKSVARSYMWWPGLDKDLEQLAKSCQSCQAVKGAPPAAPLHPWIWPSKPWQRVHLDFAGPFQGVMFLVCVDAYSKWPEVRVMTTTTVSKTLNVLREWFSVHGIPEQIVTDNGPQFIAEEFDEFTKRNGIKHVKSAPYHPASNGLAERFVQSLKQSLKASANDGRSLCQRLSSYLLTYRSTAHATTGVPPCKLLFQRDLRTRLSLLQPSCEKSVLDKQSQQKSAHDRRSRSRAWIAGDRVMVRNHHEGPDWIPATVMEVIGPVTYLVETDRGQRWKRHADQIKDWLSPAPRVTQETENSNSEVDTDTFETASEVSSPGTDPNMEDPADSSLPEEPRAGTPENPETPTEETSPPDTEQSSILPRRYPTRARQPPHRYDPVGFGTNHVMVI